MKKEIILLIVCFLLVSSCSTMSGFDQRVKLTSRPDGAKVYHDGKYLGKTPGYFYVRRFWDADLVLKKSGYSDVKLNLDSSYRWERSFLANMIWGWFAPVGWALDLVTGTAFDFDKVEPKDFPKLSRVDGSKYEHEPKFVLAVAPPLSSHELLSDEVGSRLTGELKGRYPKAKVIPYENGEVSFTSFGSTHKGFVKDEFEDDLYEDIGNTHVAKVRLKKSKTKINASVEVEDIFMENLKGRFNKSYKTDSFVSLSSGSVLENILKSLSLIPNSITFDMGVNTNEQAFTASDRDGEDYSAKQKSKVSALSYLSGISAGNILNSRVRSRIDFIFSASPRYGIIFSKAKFKRDGGGELQDSQLSRLGLSVGFAPEIALESPIGYTYNRTGFVLKYENLTMERADGIKGSSSDYSIVPDVEFGHSFFITKDLNFRMFYGATFYSRNLLQSAVSKVSRYQIEANDNFTSRAGFTFGYFLPQGKSFIKSLFY